jgi:hypothetical protein
MSTFVLGDLNHDAAFRKIRSPRLIFPWQFFAERMPGRAAGL